MKKIVLFSVAVVMAGCGRDRGLRSSNTGPTGDAAAVGTGGMGAGGNAGARDAAASGGTSIAGSTATSGGAGNTSTGSGGAISPGGSSGSNGGTGVGATGSGGTTSSGGRVDASGGQGGSSSGGGSASGGSADGSGGRGGSSTGAGGGGSASGGSADGSGGRGGSSTGTGGGGSASGGSTGGSGGRGGGSSDTGGGGSASGGSTDSGGAISTGGSSTGTTGGATTGAGGSTGGAAGNGGTSGTGGATSSCAGCLSLERCWNAELCVAKSVQVPANFLIDATEVTRSQYAAWLATNPTTTGQTAVCSWNTSFTPDATCMATSSVCQGASCANHPQPCIDMCDASAYCTAVGKRLCTESEWSNACTSNGVNRFTYGTSPVWATCHDGTDSSYTTTVPVGSMPGCQSPVPGYAGVFDLIGNVSEWVDNCTGSAGATDSCQDRGTSFGMSAAMPECSQYGVSPRRAAVGPRLGFRCCATLG